MFPLQTPGRQLINNKNEYLFLKMYQIEHWIQKGSRKPFIFVTEITDRKAKWQSDHKALKAIQSTYTNSLPHITTRIYIPTHILRHIYIRMSMLKACWCRNNCCIEFLITRLDCRKLLQFMKNKWLVSFDSFEYVAYKVI